MGCKDATTPTGREWSRLEEPGWAKKKRKGVDGGREHFQNF
jgi:hypothetical protein